MICTEVAGMKRILVKIVLPVSLLAVWMITCYPICRKAEGFDFFLYWVLVGCPYGIRKMCMILIPKNFGIAGSIGILALNCIVGGLIGGVVVILRMVMVLMEIIKIISDSAGFAEILSDKAMLLCLIDTCSMCICSWIES